MDKIILFVVLLAINLQNILNILQKSIDLYRNSVVVKFILHAFLLYIFWYLIYERRTSFAVWFDEAMLIHLTSLSKAILLAFGYDIFEEPNYIFGILGSSGIRIGPPCNGISLLVLYAGFIIAFPAPIKNKWGILILGLLLIHLLNIIRILALVLLAYYHRDWLEFNHDYTFTLIVYAVTFALWVKWINSIKDKTKIKEAT